MTTHTVSASTRGQLECDDVTGRSCAGYLSPQAICLDVRRPMTVDIEVTRASVDTVLALTGPGTRAADDDGGNGTNSRLREHLAAGSYMLYTGTYHRRDRGDLSLAISDASPRPTPPGRPGRVWRPGDGPRHGPGAVPVRNPAAAACPAGSEVVVLGRRRDSAFINTFASGEVDSTDVMGTWESGWLPRSAQICLVVNEPGYYDIEVVNSRADTTLGLVSNTCGLRLYDDDGGDGWLSRLSTHLDRGAYSIYVGTYMWDDRESAQLAISQR